jgi:type III pantothenate kinase
MAVDVGNTQTVLGLIEGEEARGQWRIATEAHRTADELAVCFAGILALEGLSPDEVSAMIVSSVVPGLTRSYRNLAFEVFRVPYFAVTAEMETGLDIRYDDPGSVGADRIVNAVATGKH